jgi:hypothetical protein
MRDDTRFRVVRFFDGVPLEGEPSPELVEASLAALSDPVGAVFAYKDDAGVWQHVPIFARGTYVEELGHDVVAVFVEAT